ncbi:MAG: hypothetical protein HC849_25200 [Oscillatoriales cyanobacterium RU_3_3]|nr:hypothetical protein [Oscillatoriales cyanobacterium RU_3_3]
MSQLNGQPTALTEETAFRVPQNSVYSERPSMHPSLQRDRKFQTDSQLP